ncbi:MAG TPA: hypothetical protein VGD74_05190, partial [Vulgatibacter sp.]
MKTLETPMRWMLAAVAAALVATGPMEAVAQISFDGLDLSDDGAKKPKPKPAPRRRAPPPKKGPAPKKTQPPARQAEKSESAPP